MLEGGGQILRNAAALAAITSTPIKVSKIRAGRSKPGLRAQHLAGLQLVAELCQGNLDGGSIGSQEISLTPHQINSGHHVADTKTAGSCMLLAQVRHDCIHTTYCCELDANIRKHAALPAVTYGCSHCTFAPRSGTTVHALLHKKHHADIRNSQFPLCYYNHVLLA